MSPDMELWLAGALRACRSSGATGRALRRLECEAFAESLPPSRRRTAAAGGGEEIGKVEEKCAALAAEVETLKRALQSSCFESKHNVSESTDGKSVASITNLSSNEAEHFDIASVDGESSQVDACDGTKEKVEAATNQECATARIFARNFGTICVI